MPKALPILDEFLAALPADRRDTMTTVHEASTDELGTHGWVMTTRPGWPGSKMLPGCICPTADT